jgi:hypothetical protein
MTKCLEAKFYSGKMIDDENLPQCQPWNSKYQGVMRFENEIKINPKYFSILLGLSLIQHEQ